MAELRRVPSGRQGSVVLNLEARILHATGRLKEAADALRSSLKLDPKQKEVQEQLAVILLDLGRNKEARRHLRYAERLGNTAAKYHLARMDTAPEESALLFHKMQLVSVGKE